MYRDQSAACVFSGDVTSGYHGGSEYFDLTIPLFREQYPVLRYVVFTDNVYTRGVSFSEAFCKAGFMIREENDSGQVYEPKTVQTAFRILGDSSFAYLFALDLETREIIWLNITANSKTSIAGEADISVIMSYFDQLEEMNLAKFFRGIATDIVDCPEDADVIVADRYKGEMSEHQILIRSIDTEKLLAYMN